MSLFVLFKRKKKKKNETVRKVQQLRNVRQVDRMQFAQMIATSLQILKTRSRSVEMFQLRRRLQVELKIGEIFEKR